MQRLSTTPFGRRQISSGLLAARALADAPAPSPAVGKWPLFRQLTTARSVFGLSSRALTVLNALLSFHPQDDLAGEGPLIVFPSNRALAERAHGMSEPTLRRHLAALVEAGMILRHDSPNGKRYAARDGTGALTVAFGFDLRPMLVRATEIAAADQAVRDAAEALRRAREAVVLLVRDIGKLTDYGMLQVSTADWLALETETAELRRALRRRLSADDLRRLSAQAETLLQKVRAACVDHEESEETTGSAAQTERHHQNSKPDSQDSEPCHDQARGDPIRKEPNPAARAGQGATIPLPLVVKACPSLATYWPGQIRDWPDLVRAAEALHGWLGISPDAWRQAEQAMGSATAAIAVACLLERAGDIRSPGGYLRRLTEQAEAGAFSPGPMVMALLTRPDRVAA